MLSGVQVVAYDFGIKTNILRRLASFGCRITVVPATYPASEVLKMNPDGVFFSNGPVRRGHGAAAEASAGT
jgi:carbamoyl-phosphate synthase small subunit